MKFPDSRGFTLVELLVVIVVIGMLAGLFFPTCISRREHGRRIVCMNNQSQIALALLNYESAHGEYPGWRHALKNGREVSWTTMLLPYLECNQEWQKLSSESPNEEDITAISNLHIRVLQCPSSDRDNTKPDISYIANCGKMDAEFSAVSPMNPTGHVADAERKNGVFFDHVETETKTSSVFISKHNGTSKTLLISETLQAGSWSEKPRENLLGFCFPDTSFLNQQRNVCSGKNAPVVPVLINHCCQGDLAIANGRIDGLGEYRFARPASFHPGLVISAFCDRSVRSINENIAPAVFERLMVNDTTPIESIE